MAAGDLRVTVTVQVPDSVPGEGDATSAPASSAEPGTRGTAAPPAASIVGRAMNRPKAKATR